MEIEKLIEQLQKSADFEDYPVVASFVASFAAIIEKKYLREAATALEQLQAENDRLRRERDDAIRQLKFFAPCAGCKWYRGIKGCAHELGCDTNHDYYEFVAKDE